MKKEEALVKEKGVTSLKSDTGRTGQEAVRYRGRRALVEDVGNDGGQIAGQKSVRVGATKGGKSRTARLYDKNARWDVADVKADKGNARGGKRQGGEARGKLLIIAVLSLLGACVCWFVASQYLGLQRAQERAGKNSVRMVIPVDMPLSHVGVGDSLELWTGEGYVATGRGDGGRVASGKGDGGCTMVEQGYVAEGQGRVKAGEGRVTKTARTKISDIFGIRSFPCGVERYCVECFVPRGAASRVAHLMTIRATLFSFEKGVLVE
ncbi:hypothetical protein [Actinotignum urinale]|uniref:Uncharacterized protein n=1 Tax=Actinotignum urinale TaxID=190146 RepID=A0AAW9HMW8_9ACTO|nr:hypothetical protein [Actinotignum urinale]MDY5132928.1 hypothetical protein [Actinotignum urinale]MDY5155226.1 hypothetical protein [Actinotignum urinale]MDY5161068.1 hypothetical protein [Actinotignum urinale]